MMQFNQVRKILSVKNLKDLLMQTLVWLVASCMFIVLAVLLTPMFILDFIMDWGE